MNINSREFETRTSLPNAVITIPMKSEPSVASRGTTRVAHCSFHALIYEIEYKSIAFTQRRRLATMLRVCGLAALATIVVSLGGFHTLPALSLPVSTTSTCRQNEQIVWDLLVFLATNYLAHAGTVPHTLDIGTYISIGKGRFKTSIYWPPILALFLPFSGALRFAFMMLAASCASLVLGDVGVAMLSGAMIIVARTSLWEPPIDREELVYVQLPEGFLDMSEEYVK